MSPASYRLLHPASWVFFETIYLYLPHNPRVILASLVAFALRARLRSPKSCRSLHPALWVFFETIYLYLPHNSGLYSLRSWRSRFALGFRSPKSCRSLHPASWVFTAPSGFLIAGLVYHYYIRLSSEKCRVQANFARFCGRTEKNAERMSACVDLPGAL